MQKVSAAGRAPRGRLVRENTQLWETDMHIDMSTHVSPHVAHTLRRTDSSCKLRPAFNLNSKPQIFVQPSSG